MNIFLSYVAEGTSTTNPPTSTECISNYVFVGQNKNDIIANHIMLLVEFM